MQVETIDDYRKMLAITRGVPKRARSKAKRQVKIRTMRSLSRDPQHFSFQVRRAYRKLWHEAGEELTRKVIGRRAIHATP